MKTIYKYPVDIYPRSEIELPESACVLSVDLDPTGLPCLWCSLDTYDKRKKTVHIFVIGTGHAIPPEAINYINTFRQGPFIWHIYSD